MHFKTFEHKYMTPNGKNARANLIVLEHTNGVIQFTNFHRFVKSKTGRITAAGGGKVKTAFIVEFLNYAFFTKRIKKLTDITTEVVEDFIKAYNAGLINKSAKKQSTAQHCTNTVIEFLNELIKEYPEVNIEEDDLYKEQIYQNSRSYKLETRKVPAFDVYVDDDNTKETLRDIPNKAFEILYNHIRNYHKDLLGLLMLQAFAGLRPGEACSVRAADSPLGPGIIIHEVGGMVRSVKIDLTEDLYLRTDKVATGYIKRKREQPVQPYFLDEFMDAYREYTLYMQGSKQGDNAKKAFSINKQGNPITVDSWRQRFERIVRKELVPILLESDDPELVEYGHLLTEYNLGPHALRHWYTVQLVLAGYGEAELMAARGDRSPESASAYIRDKGDLLKQYRKANDAIFGYLYDRGDDEYGL